MKKLSVKVIGAGPSGSLLAIALANINTKVYLFDILDMEKLLSRDRSYAITHSSRRLLEKLGIWSELKNKAIPFKELSVLEEEEGHKITEIQSNLSELKSKVEEQIIQLKDEKQREVISVERRYPQISSLKALNKRKIEIEEKIVQLKEEM